MENEKMPDPKKVIIKIDDYEFEAGQYIIIVKGKKNDDYIHSLSLITSPTTGANMLEELEKHEEKLLKNMLDCSICPERFNCDTYRKGEN